MKHAAHLLTVILSAGCGSPSEPDSDSGIIILAGAGVRDTVQSVPVQALVVRITPAVAGQVVRFEQQDNAAEPQVLLSPLEGFSFGPLLVDTTDAAGKVTARVMLGTRAGNASLRIVVPELGSVDSVSYTILPGRPAAVHLLPRDTTLLVSGTLTVRGGSTDRFGNDRSDAVVLTAQSPPLTIAAKLVTAIQTGRGRVVGTVGTIADTIFVGVVPNGTVSAVIDDVRVFRTDGSQIVHLSSGLSPGFGADWSPDGQLLAFDNAGGAIRVIGQDGVFRQLTRGTGSELYPKFSADGQWLYYSANTGAWAIRRVRSDGTGDELVVGTQGNEVAPAPSPDGTRMAYVLTGPDELRIRTLATGESVLLAPNGHTPAWSPAGDLIAYNATRSGQEIFVITPSGLNSRRVSRPGVGYVLGIDWSPDGKFLIARSGLGTIDLIEVASGTTFPLTFTTGWGSPAWKQ